MRTMGIAPGSSVLLIERRGAQQVVHNALVVRLSMDETLAGSNGEMAVDVVSVMLYGTVELDHIVHLSHGAWTEGRVGLAYEELPGPLPGICRFCNCTENRPCPGGCGWMDLECTVCTAAPCHQRYMEEMFAIMRVTDDGDLIPVKEDPMLDAMPIERRMSLWWTDRAQALANRGDEVGAYQATLQAEHFSRLADLRKQDAGGSAPERAA